MDPTSWQFLISNLGFPIALTIALLVYIRQIHKEGLDREIRLANRINELEGQDRDTLVELTTETAQAIRENYRSIRRLTASINDLIKGTGGRLAMDDGSFFPHQVLREPGGLGMAPLHEIPSGETTTGAQRDDDDATTKRQRIVRRGRRELHGLNPKSRDG